MEGAGDLEIAELETPHKTRAALLVHRAPRDDRHAHGRLDRLLDGLGRAHLAHDVKHGEVEPGLRQRGLEGGAGSRALLPQKQWLSSKVLEIDFLLSVPPMPDVEQPDQLVRTELA